MINTKSDGCGKLDPWADYMNAAFWYAEILRRIKSSIKPHGCAWVFMNWRGLATMTKAACDASWPIASCLVWSKGGLGPGNYLRTTSELALFFAGEEYEMPRHDMPDVMEFAPVPPTKRHHPAEKPVELIEWMLQAVTERGTVLDPFMGSGSTGVACANTDRRFEGIEINKSYFEVAERRISEAYALKGRQATPLGTCSCLG